MGASFWSPLFLAFASFVFNLYWTVTKSWGIVSVGLGMLTFGMVGAAYLAARHSRRLACGINENSQHMRGGVGIATGTDSEALGGDAGKGPFGGDGGDAIATGVRSKARGGRGGS